MHRPLTLLAAALALAACTPDGQRGDDTAVVQPAVTPTTDPADAGSAPAGAIPETRLTIYSGDYEALGQSATPGIGMPGYALVERPLSYALKRGTNSVSAASVPPAMDVEAAVLRPAGDGTSVLSQRYLAGLSVGGDVLGQAVGQRVAVEHTSGGAKQTDNGTLVSSSGTSLALALNDGRIKVIRDYDSFSVIDGTTTFPGQPSLQWTVDAAAAGDAAFTLHYPMGGMAWRAEYTATLAPGDGCALSLDGAALVANRSGVTFTDARVTLVAGEPERVRQDRPEMRERAAVEQMAMDAAAGNMPTQRRSAEYHAYDLPRAVRITQGATERIALFPTRTKVACERAYVVEADSQEWQPPQPMLDPGYRGSTGKLPVVVAVSLQNSKESGLGQPLPAGRVRVFDGADFLGESRLDHIAAGGEVRVEVGEAFDLSAERENTAFNVDRSGRTITESFAVTLRNAKPGDATVRVVEPLPRWSDWEIVESSVPSERQDARHAVFEVPVPAGGETRLTYTVRYRWARDVIQ
ncbi:DUF4139 domain-containing protein [Lysobacter sp. A3-1-A15]|uniref:DUF4139 domain-containing protein n=1 Tax=Novilysobacter viscosus TaxID=3098602 RepID=UPI002EDB1D92